MGRFVSENQIKLYKGFVVGIREDLGRKVTLHIPGTPLNCPNCLYDSVNKKSAGIYSPLPAQFPVTDHNGVSTTEAKEFRGGICPVCNDAGKVTTGETTKVVQCLIRSLKTDQKRYIVQGIEADNDFRLKCDIKFRSDFEKTRIVEIDGIPAEVSTIIPGGLRDLIQIKIFLKKSEWPPGTAKDVTRY